MGVQGWLIIIIVFPFVVVPFKLESGNRVSMPNTGAGAGSTSVSSDLTSRCGCGVVGRVWYK